MRRVCQRGSRTTQSAAPAAVDAARGGSRPARSRPLATALAAAGLLAGGGTETRGQRAEPGLLRAEAPVRQSELTFETAGPPRPLTLRDASRDDRWLGLEVRDVRWAPDGSRVYFRWHLRPEPGQDPAADPWFAVDGDGEAVEQIPPDDQGLIPDDDVEWSADHRYAVWVGDGALVLYDAEAEAGGRTRSVFRGSESAAHPRFRAGGVDFTLGEDLYRYEPATGAVRRLTRRHPIEGEAREIAAWLEDEQLRVFERLMEDRERERAADARERAEPGTPQPIPVPVGARIEEPRLSPDGRWLALRVRTPARAAERTEYMDYVTRSGYAESLGARSKVGEPRDRTRLGILPRDPAADPDSLEVTWVTIAEAGERPLVWHGPEWSLEGDRAVVVAVSEDHKDRWIAEVDPETGKTTVLAHDRDDAWLGGPPLQPNYGQPGLVEWLPGGRIAFASERSGWSHLYLIEPDGEIRALTRGEWEVRDATLSRDRETWLIQASREHPSEDHVYLMPAAGGELVRLTRAPGRHEGAWSPDGERLAVLSSDNTHLPDLFLTDPAPDAEATRVTVSGADEFYRHPLVEPEMVSFPHPDGDPVWAALYRPATPNAERAAVLHIHGGGYRQFAHRGWSVYGWDLHLGFLHYLLEQGYTVLDFDYRGSAGFGRDYRTDIYRSMGISDVDGAAAAVDYLAREHGVDPGRVGIYGVSYGGFMTLMSLFRYPGTFAAGIARAAVSDWSDYSHGWTRRILNLPYEDPEAYRTSSPVYHAEGLEDALLITHGLVDDNVHFQDAAQIVQRLIELEKDFEVMYYPKEPHTIESEPSRFDYVKRAAAFFQEHLLRP